MRLFFARFILALGWIILSLGCGENVLDQQPVVAKFTSGVVIESSLASAGEGTTLSVPVLPNVPLGVAVDTLDVNDLQVSWDPVASAPSYRVYIAVVSANDAVEWTKYVANASPFILLDAITDTVLDVYVMVSAVNLAGEGPTSAAVTLPNSSVVVNKLTTVPSGDGQMVSNTSPLLSVYPNGDANNISLDSDLTIKYVASNAIRAIFLQLLGSTPVFGKLLDSPGMLRFSPTQLSANTTYLVVLTFFVDDGDGRMIAYENRWSFTTLGSGGGAVGTGVTPPVLIGSDPMNNETNVSVNTKIKFFFSQPMALGTVTNAGITVHDPLGSLVAGEWKLKDNNEVRFKPLTVLQGGGARYQVFINSTVTNTANIPLGIQTTGVFYTEQNVFPSPLPTTVPGIGGTDTTAPGYMGSIPNNNQRDVPITTQVTIKFSEPILPTSTLNSGLMVHELGGVMISGTWLPSGNNMIFTPSTPFRYSTGYQVFVGPVTDIAGNRLSNMSNWIFHTASANVFSTPLPTASPLPATGTDTTAPQYLSGTPGENQNNVPVNSSITLQFSEPVNPISVNQGLMVHEVGGAMLTNNWMTTGSTTAFQPIPPLKANTSYQVFVGLAVTDIAGNALSNPKNWTFVTASGLAATPLPNNSLFPTPIPTSGIIPPILHNVYPATNERNVPVTAKIKISFSDVISLASVQNGGIVVQGFGGVVMGAWVDGEQGENHSELKFTPTLPLLGNGAQYNIVINPTVTDAVGTPLGINYTGTFFTQ